MTGDPEFKDFQVPASFAKEVQGARLLQVPQAKMVVSYSGPKPAAGQELVIDYKTGKLRAKTRGRRRMYTSAKFLVVEAYSPDQTVLIQLSHSPRGGKVL